jgi:hypothetical protein
VEPATPAQPAPAAAIAPPWRDPWALLSAAAVLPLVFFSRGTPRGVAVAEDFDFLRRALLEGGGSWLDGGGSLAFWRPVSHQLYYRLLGTTILEHPGLVAALHVAMLGLAGLLLYRVLRLEWPGPRAAAAASFPLLAESTRTLVCWPSHFVDLGVFFFLALALHELSRRRTYTAIPAMLAALLCKEVALVGVLLLPFVPGARRDPRARLRSLGVCGGVALAWAAAYLYVRRTAGLELPHGIERDPAIVATPLAAKLAWAIGNSLRATFSLPRARELGFTAGVAVVLIGAAAIATLVSAQARSRWRAARGWVAWGAAWGLLSWAALASIFPMWAPNRSQLGSVGFGVGAVALASVVHPLAPAALVVARLGLFAAGPATPERITEAPEDRGAFMDYPKLSRLQQLMDATRTALTARYPVLRRGARLAWHDLPLSAEYAFGESHAIQAWYRDSTLRVVALDQFDADPSLRVTTFLSYQPEYRPQVVLVDPPAERAKLDGVAALRAGRWVEALAAFDRARGLQRDRAAVVFLGDVAGRRAYCLAQLGRWKEAWVSARMAVCAAPEDIGARYVIALVQAARRERRASLATLDELLAIAPRHQEALELKRALTALPATAAR